MKKPTVTEVARSFSAVLDSVELLWVTSTADDGAFFARLEDLGPDGRAIPVTDGQLRAIHRRLERPARPDVPLARSFLRRDAAPLVPGEAAELVFDLEPTSYRFAVGHRVRLAISGAERDHFARIPAAGEVRVRIHRDRSHPSRIELPLGGSPEMGERDADGTRLLTSAVCSPAGVGSPAGRWLPNQIRSDSSLVMKTLSVTEVARNFSAVLDSVERKQEEIVLVRNRREVARLVPEPQRQDALEVFGDLF
jgi:hypothetical protein